MIHRRYGIIHQSDKVEDTILANNGQSISARSTISEINYN